jgi:single-strand DNA-binding protein
MEGKQDKANSVTTVRRRSLFAAARKEKVMSLNKVLLIGRLGRDPEIRYTPSGMPVVNFPVATGDSYVDRAGKRQERIAWHRVIVTGKLALTCSEYLKKRLQVFVEGRLRTRERGSGVYERCVEVITTRVEYRDEAERSGRQSRAPERRVINSTLKSRILTDHSGLVEHEECSKFQ